tara:strand:+ start:61 stop:1992 length:1932 start_codon:yes stop_codon:yes gene_type:complete
MTGGLIQLVSKGHQDLYLTGDPKFTYFKFTYKKHIIHTIKIESIPFINEPEFGLSNIQVDINSDANFFKNIYFKTRIKYTTTTYVNSLVDSSKKKFAKWKLVNNFALAMIKRIDFVIDNKIIDTVHGQQLIMNYELLNTREKNKTLNILLGNTNNITNFTNHDDGYVDIYIPIPFFIDNSRSLPIEFLLHSNIKLIFTFIEQNKIIIKQDSYFDTEQDPDTTYSSYYTNNILDDIDSFNTYDIKLELTNSELLIDNIYIHNEHTKYYKKKEIEILINQSCYQENILDFNSDLININIEFSNPNKFLFYAIQQDGLITGKKYLALPGSDFFEIAAKRFCLRYCTTGHISPNDYLYSSNYSGASSNLIDNFGIFEDSSQNVLEYDSKLVFDYGLTSMHDNNTYPKNNTENSNILDSEYMIIKLFHKLTPTINKKLNKLYDDNNKIFARIENINIDLSQLNDLDKYILSMPTENIDNLMGSRVFPKVNKTNDINNEGFYKYDKIVYDYNTFTLFLNNEVDIIKNNDIFFNHQKINKINFNKYYSYLNPYKYNMENNKNGIHIYSYSLHPNNNDPTGSINISNLIYSISLKINTQLSSLLLNEYKNPSFTYDILKNYISQNSRIIFISSSYNIIKVKNNNLTLLFSK